MEFVSIEARSKLFSCNIYICLQKNTTSNNVKVKLSEESIILSIEGTLTTLILPSIRIIPTSISALNVNSNWIWFHAQTKPIVSSYGSIRAEFVVNNDSQGYIKNSLNSNTSLLKNTQYIILCKCCKSPVSKETSFEKVFPFPNMNFDPSEWFCCKSHSESGNFLNLLHPQEKDYYYGLFFSILNKNIFSSGMRVDKSALLCKNCLYSLGKIHLEHSFKIWNYAVEFKSLNNELGSITTSDPLTDFIEIIRNSESQNLGIKIVLESFVKHKIHCLIIKPMAWELCLITEPEEVFNLIEVHLEQRQVIKALYKYTTNVCTVCSNDMNVTYYEVGLPVIETALKYLLSSTKRIPQPYRATGDYYIGHIDLGAHTK